MGIRSHGFQLRWLRRSCAPNPAKHLLRAQMRQSSRQVRSETKQGRALAHYARLHQICQTMPHIQKWFLVSLPPHPRLTCHVVGTYRLVRRIHLPAPKYFRQNNRVFAISSDLLRMTNQWPYSPPQQHF